MTLYLLRHAEAGSHAMTAEADAKRALTPHGIEQTKRVAHFCKKQKIAPEIILSSPLVRARETAEIVVSEIGASLEIVPWLASGMSPEIAISELRAYEKLESAMIVGHEPDFSQLVAHLLGMKTTTAIHLRKASLTAISFSDKNFRNGKLEFLIPPNFL